VKQYIGCDMHKKYSVFVTMDEQGRVRPAVTVASDSLELDSYLKTIGAGTAVAVEASGGWYWFVDRLEEAGLDVRLVHPLEAKKRMGGRNKTDRLDALGLAMLLRNGTLPEVWIPPAAGLAASHDHTQEPHPRSDPALWAVGAGRGQESVRGQGAGAVVGLCRGAACRDPTGDAA
jgi:Transposase